MSNSERLETLQEVVKAWLDAKEEKSAVMKEHNDGIKVLEEQIKTLSGRIEEDKYQENLPFDGGPRIELDEGDE